MTEMKAVIKESNSGKAAGVDGASAEMMKKQTSWLLTEKLINICESEGMPET